MSTTLDVLPAIEVLSRGEAIAMDKSLLDPRAVKTVRFADEAAWTVATALARALASVQADMSSLLDRTGLIVNSPEGPATTIAAVGADARAGQPSPLRFPAANPGSMTGVPCILFGLRGPVLNLLLPPARGVPLGWLIASAWLHQHAAACVALVTAVQRGPHSCLARALLLRQQETGSHATGTLTPPAVAEATSWLVGGPAG